ncbi:hypothetical protein Syun_004333 [Stephania yunnanensis]|uniref:Uncharacterized protein n=1 Tax=Stephania yunnanensis TaxID=152371 RepID=A0AAP0L2Z2_9MAGN
MAGSAAAVEDQQRAAGGGRRGGRGGWFQRQEVARLSCRMSARSYGFNGGSDDGGSAGNGVEQRRSGVLPHRSILDETKSWTRHRDFDKARRRGGFPMDFGVETSIEGHGLRRCSRV